MQEDQADVLYLGGFRWPGGGVGPGSVEPCFCRAVFLYPCVQNRVHSRVTRSGPSHPWSLWLAMVILLSRPPKHLQVILATF